MEVRFALYGGDGRASFFLKKFFFSNQKPDQCRGLTTEKHACPPFTSVHHNAAKRVPSSLSFALSNNPFPSSPAPFRCSYRSYPHHSNCHYLITTISIPFTTITIISSSIQFLSGRVPLFTRVPLCFQALTSRSCHTTINSKPFTRLSQSSAMEKYSELARCVEAVERDASKFFVNGNKAAGTRARKHLQELKQLAQDLRVLIQDTKNEKTRAPAAGGAEQDAPAQNSYDDPSGHVGF